ncbi:MAG: hypothetical protein HY059_04300 [Proteobacteria bacterium]|nr:hypothetical protein [Pseudomonadota bacterium]
MTYDVAYFLTTEPFKSLIGFLGSAIIAVLAAYIAVPLALKRFKSERIWDKQLSTFSDIVESLSEMLRITGIRLDRHVERKDDDNERSKAYLSDLSDRYKKAERKLEGASATARLLLGPEVEKAINRFEKRMEQAAQAFDLFECLDEEGDAIKDCLESILNLAKSAGIKIY